MAVLAVMAAIAMAQPLPDAVRPPPRGLGHCVGAGGLCILQNYLLGLLVDNGLITSRVLVPEQSPAVGQLALRARSHCRRQEQWRHRVVAHAGAQRAAQHGQPSLTWTRRWKTSTAWAVRSTRPSMWRRGRAWASPIC